jgi:uncharacterized phage protein (TIGR02218 family)
MKTVSAGLQAVIDAGEVQWAFIWKLKRRDGIIHAFTEHDQVLSVDLLDGDGTVAYQPGTISEPSEPDQSLGVKIDNADLTGATGIVNGSGVDKNSIIAGRFDGAEITTAHCHWPDTTLGAMIASVQYAGDAVDREQTFSISSRSLVSRFDARPTIKIEPECRHEFGSTECGYDLSGQTHTGIITALTDARRYVTDVIQAADYFGYGVLEFTAGDNYGVKYDINTSGAAGEIELSGPPRLPVSIGDGVALTRGCAHNKTACTGFNNIINFGGFPSVPGTKIRNQKGTGAA